LSGADGMEDEEQKRKKIEQIIDCMEEEQLDQMLVILINANHDLESG
jgi:hypothetical protein